MAGSVLSSGAAFRSASRPEVLEPRRKPRGTRVSPEEARVLESAAAWAQAMEAMAQAEEPCNEGRLVEEFEAAQYALLKAVLIWQLRSR